MFHLDYALKHSDVDPQQVVAMFVRYVSKSGLRISTSEFMGNLEQKRGGIQRYVDAVDR